MRCRVTRFVVALGAVLTLSAASAFPAAAASKPNKAKKACAAVLLQANQAMASLDGVGGALAAEQKALTDYAASTRDAAAGQKLYADTQSVAASVFAVVAQAQGSTSAYTALQPACQKALGIKDADVTPPTTPTTTLSR
jgi:hypothetical protein